MKCWFPLQHISFRKLIFLVDPEFPTSFISLEIIKQKRINVEIDNLNKEMLFVFSASPTSENCSMLPVIGLSLYNSIRNWESQHLKKILVPRKWIVKSQILYKMKNHLTGMVYCKQFSDKERVCAAMENNDIRRLILHCLNEKKHLPGSK